MFRRVFAERESGRPNSRGGKRRRRLVSGRVRCAPRKPRLEPLEARQLLAADAVTPSFLLPPPTLGSEDPGVIDVTDRS